MFTSRETPCILPALTRTVCAQCHLVFRIILRTRSYYFTTRIFSFFFFFCVVQNIACQPLNVIYKHSVLKMSNTTIVLTSYRLALFNCILGTLQHFESDSFLFRMFLSFRLSACKTSSHNERIFLKFHI